MPTTATVTMPTRSMRLWRVLAFVILACLTKQALGMPPRSMPRRLRRRAEADRAGALLALRKQEREGDACAAGRR